MLGMITVQILKGLEYLHKVKKVTHRDIKPSNILADRNGAIKIADFGVSGGTAHTVESLKTWVGTLIYMCPNRINGESYFSDTDIWSLGIMLLEACTGKIPFRSQSRPKLEFLELRQRICEDPSPSLPPNECYSDEFRDFIKICLTKEGGKRPAASQLLYHPYILKYNKIDKVFLSKWIKTIPKIKGL
jgi:serine/threonine protein kinase